MVVFSASAEPALVEPSQYSAIEYAELRQELRRNQNRVRVLEEELNVSRRGGELSAHVADAFSLIYRASDLRIIPTSADTDALCDSGATHVFQVTIENATAARESLRSGFSVVGCPRTTSDGLLAVPRKELYLLLALRPETPLRACVHVELFNGDADNMLATDGTPCRRLALPLSVPFTRGCVHMKANSSAAVLGLSRCTYTKASPPGAWQRGEWRSTDCDDTRQHGRRPRRELRWMRVLGDSVTLLLKDALFDTFAHNETLSADLSAVETSPVSSAGHELAQREIRWQCECTESGRCVRSSGRLGVPAGWPLHPLPIASWLPPGCPLTDVRSQVRQLRAVLRSADRRTRQRPLDPAHTAGRVASSHRAPGRQRWRGTSRDESRAARSANRRTAG